MITFLLGAGASCGTMPLANNMAKAMEVIADKIDGLYLLGSNPLSNPQEAAFCKELIALSQDAVRHNTIDTYAKRLYLTKEEDKFRHLKCLLSAYLTLEQIFIGNCDQRYDSFWAAILEDQYNKLPDNIRIVTWNYDSQLEISYKVFCPSEMNDLKSICNLLNIVVNNNRQNVLSNKNRFGIYKLNGTANVYGQYDLKGSNIRNDELMNSSFDTEWCRASVSAVIENYFHLKELSKKRVPTLSFA